ncbi:MAG: mannose-1-phosphate guanylyltransferase [Flavobacteriales bacterium]
MNNNYYAVIMAGGIGSRFWPISTTEFPKQFHDMLGTGKSLLQTTFSRLNGLIPSKNIQILTNQRYLDLVMKQLPAISKKQVVLEPAMKNTAPCILLAALKIYKENPKAQMIVAPSDHWIEDETSFLKDVETCFKTSEKEAILFTLGIHPTFPNTGFGYIESDKGSNDEIKKVKQFREKPDYETAKKFLAEGNYFWNAGIFIWSAKTIIDAFAKFLPEMYNILSKGTCVFNTQQEKDFINKNYELVENISIDYGILEKSKQVYVKNATFDWNDLGTWGALYDKINEGNQKNAVVRATPFLEEASGNMIFTKNQKLVVIDGLKDYIVVDKEDVLLIYPKSKEQEIKKLRIDIENEFGKKYS